MSKESRVSWTEPDTHDAAARWWYEYWKATFLKKMPQEIDN